MLPIQERWPPVYDAEDLKARISELTSSNDIEKRFYSPEPKDVALCHGDIVKLDANVVKIDEHGEGAIGDPAEYWLVVSNTCDLDRDLKEVPFAILVPLLKTKSYAEISHDEMQALRHYKYVRGFYVPTWPGSAGEDVMLADFRMWVSVDRRLFTNGKATLVARLSYAAWVLLHSCLVRFLARDDGRYASD